MVRLVTLRYHAPHYAHHTLHTHGSGCRTVPHTFTHGLPHVCGYVLHFTARLPLVWFTPPHCRTAHTCHRLRCARFCAAVGLRGFTFTAAVPHLYAPPLRSAVFFYYWFCYTRTTRLHRTFCVYGLPRTGLVGYRVYCARTPHHGSVTHRTVTQFCTHRTARVLRLRWFQLPHGFVHTTFTPRSPRLGCWFGYYTAFSVGLRYTPHTRGYTRFPVYTRTPLPAFCRTPHVLPLHSSAFRVCSCRFAVRLRFAHLTTVCVYCHTVVLPRFAVWVTAVLRGCPCLRLPLPPLHCLVHCYHTAHLRTVRYYATRFHTGLVTHTRFTVVPTFFALPPLRTGFGLHGSAAFYRTVLYGWILRSRFWFTRFVYHYFTPRTCHAHVYGYAPAVPAVLRGSGSATALRIPTAAFAFGLQVTFAPQLLPALVTAVHARFFTVTTLRLRSLLRFWFTCRFPRTFACAYGSHTTATGFTFFTFCRTATVTCRLHYLRSLLPPCHRVWFCLCYTTVPSPHTVTAAVHHAHTACTRFWVCTPPQLRCYGCGLRFARCGYAHRAVALRFYRTRFTCARYHLVVCGSPHVHTVALHAVTHCGSTHLRLLRLLHTDYGSAVSPHITLRFTPFGYTPLVHVLNTGLPLLHTVTCCRTVPFCRSPPGYAGSPPHAHARRCWFTGSVCQVHHFTTTHTTTQVTTFTRSARFTRLLDYCAAPHYTHLVWVHTPLPTIHTAHHTAVLRFTLHRISYAAVRFFVTHVHARLPTLR